MELGKKQIIKIFKQNFNCKVVETPLGDGFLLSTYEAFVFSSITGSGYLDNPYMPFTPKGLLKVFYNANEYNFVTGLFDNGNLKNTPRELSLLRSYLFEDEFKIVVPMEFNSDIELQEKLIDKISDLTPSTKYIVLRIEISKKGNGLEPLMEYIANRYFASIGYVCENQIPLSHSLGSPDFGGYTIPKLYGELEKYGVSIIGLNIVELAMLSLKQTRAGEKNQGRRMIVGEAKTSTTVMEKQLLKYLNSGYFDLGIEIHPSKNNPSRTSFGILNFDENYNINYNNQINDENYVIEEALIKYQSWLSNYVKYYLVANMNNTEFQEFYKSKKGVIPSSKEEVTIFINSLDFSDILEELKKLKII